MNEGQPWFPALRKRIGERAYTCSVLNRRTRSLGAVQLSIRGDGRFARPAFRLAIAAAITVGLALGLGAFTFVYARGYSYVSNDPAACANCHIMREHFDAWHKSSHRAVATCNDCHTPHDIIGKYTVKARNGFWHSFYFTTGRFPDPLRITDGNRRVTADACRYCHADITHSIDSWPGEDQRSGCVTCHRYVGHLVR